MYIYYKFEITGSPGHLLISLKNDVCVAFSSEPLFSHRTVLKTI